jgi:glycosyltransferase involved in cell wall biosynthesis
VSMLPPPYGGLTVHTQRLVAAARRRGWRVAVVSPPGAPAGPIRRLRGLAQQLGYLARVLLTPCDVVHDHISTYSIGPGSRATPVFHAALLLVLRARRVPWILSCGNGLLPGLLASSSSRQRALYRYLYAGTRAAIAKNAPILAAFDELGIGDRSRVIGTFLEPVLPACAPSLAPAVASFLAMHPRCVVTAGFRFEPLYHLEAVVRAVARVRATTEPGAAPVGLVVLASVDEDPTGKSAFDDALRETGLGPHVLVLRDVDDALEVMSRARVFVRATDCEGDANTVKEAMLVGVPVLATDLPGRPPGLELIPLDALDRLGERLLTLLEKPDPEAIERNRVFVREDITRNTAALFDLYEEVLR